MYIFCFLTFRNDKSHLSRSLESVLLWGYPRSTSRIGANWLFLFFRLWFLSRFLLFWRATALNARKASLNRLEISGVSSYMIDIIRGSNHVTRDEHAVVSLALPVTTMELTVWIIVVSSAILKQEDTLWTVESLGHNTFKYHVFAPMGNESNRRNYVHNTPRKQPGEK